MSRPRRFVQGQLVTVLMLLTVACGGSMRQQVQSDTLLRDLPDSAFARLGQARIFFAHQSVGGNIVDGVRAVLKEDPRLTLNIVDLQGANAATGPFFAHARLGTNGAPRSKTDAFAATLEGGLGDRVDVAFQKYCFVDIGDPTDVQQVFEYYREAIRRLHQRFPRVTIVHVTAPIVAVQSGPKAIIKKLLGRMPDHYADNMRREQFNDLVRREYGGREPIFDLAAIESARPDGGRETIRFGGATSYAMLPDYTTDGGHLNDEAKKRVATDLLAFLAHVLERTP